MFCGQSREICCKIRNFCYNIGIGALCGAEIAEFSVPAEECAMRYGRLAERSNAAVLKTVEVQASGGSNPSPSAISTQFEPKRLKLGAFSMFGAFQFVKFLFVEFYLCRHIGRSVVKDIHAVVK